jgi:hypothetical protein
MTKTTPDDLVERVARRMALAAGVSFDDLVGFSQSKLMYEAEKAYAAAAPVALEEAARACEDWLVPHFDGLGPVEHANNQACNACAAAIRAMIKENT